MRGRIQNDLYITDHGECYAIVCQIELESLQNPFCDFQCSNVKALVNRANRDIPAETGLMY
jgi:hypothetical protein